MLLEAHVRQEIWVPIKHVGILHLHAKRFNPKTNWV
jgi:hypothetical protein